MNSKNILFSVLFCLSYPVLPLWSMQEVQDPFDIKKIPEIKWINNFDIEAKIIPYNNNVQRYLDVIKDKEGGILVKEKYQAFLKNYINPILTDCYSLKQRINSAETIDELFNIYLGEGLGFDEGFLSIQHMFTKYFEGSLVFLDTLHEDYYKFKSIIEIEMEEKIISLFSGKILQVGERLNALLLKNSFLHERIDFLKRALPVFLEKDIEMWNEAKDSQEGNLQGEGEQFVIQSWIGALTLVRTYVNNIEQSLSTLLSDGVFDDTQHAGLLKSSAQIIAFESGDDKAKIGLVKDVKIIHSLVEKSRKVLAQIRVLRKVYIPKFVENLKKEERKNNKTPLHLKLFVFFSILSGAGILINYFLPTFRLKIQERSLPELIFRGIVGKTGIRPLLRR